jgi:hypothetical protein
MGFAHLIPFYLFEIYKQNYKKDLDTCFDKNNGWGLCTIKNMYKMFGSCVVTVAFQSAFYM